MDQLISKFPNQIIDALSIGEETLFNVHKKQIRNVVVSGLGGSGIGGTIVSQLVANQCEVPIIVNNDYNVPEFVNKRTLFIVSSYSGNTEETISALGIAAEKGAEIACITSGGMVKRIAEEKNYNHIIIPAGSPPRAAFGLSSTALFFILEKYELIDNSFIDQLTKVSKYLADHQEDIKKEAKSIALKIHGTTPIIYAEAQYAGVAVRLRQQLNENAKILCWHHVFPEMNHNELVGWAGGSDAFSVIMFRTEDDHPKTQVRMNLSRDIFNKYTSRVIEIQALGNSKTERAYYLIHLGDWLSYYLAELREVDAIEVKVIDYLKRELAKHDE